MATDTREFRDGFCVWPREAVWAADDEITALRSTGWLEGWQIEQIRQSAEIIRQESEAGTPQHAHAGAILAQLPEPANYQ